MMDLNIKLINQCKRGVPAAQREIYDTFRHKWFSICLRYVNKREDALDVLQNALINIYSKINQFDESLGSFSSWSSRIVVNESIMFQRKYWNTAEVSGINLEMLDRAEASPEFSHLSLEQITKLIQDLPNGYRLIFNLYVMEGYDHQEIANKLNITAGTSKSQLFKAKALLKKKLTPLLKEEIKMIS